MLLSKLLVLLFVVQVVATCAVAQDWLQLEVVVVVVQRSRRRNVIVSAGRLVLLLVRERVGRHDRGSRQLFQLGRGEDAAGRDGRTVREAVGRVVVQVSARLVLLVVGSRAVVVVVAWGGEQIVLVLSVLVVKLPNCLVLHLARLEMEVGRVLLRTAPQRSRAEYQIGQVEVELAHRDVDVVRVDAQGRVQADRRLLQALAVGALQWNCFEQDHHDQVEAPHFVRLAQAVDAAHLALLVWIAQDASDPLLARHAENELLSVLLADVLAQLAQQARGPLLFSLVTFALQLLLAAPLLVQTHALLVLLEKLPLRGLQVEPTVSERLDVRQQCLDEWVKVVL